jgi:acetyl-CoA carboxylase beta subunit
MLDEDSIPYESQAGEGAPLYKGYLCTDCQLMECDKCGDATLDYSLEDNHVVCDWCTKQEQVKSRKK